MGPIAASYDHKQAGDLVAVVDGENYIEVAIINGNAAQKLAAGVGDSVEVSGED